MAAYGPAAIPVPVCSPCAVSGALSGLWELVREGCGLNSPRNLHRAEDTWAFFFELRLQFVMNLSWGKGRMGLMEASSTSERAGRAQSV